MGRVQRDPNLDSDPLIYYEPILGYIPFKCEKMHRDLDLELSYLIVLES